MSIIDFFSSVFFQFSDILFMNDNKNMEGRRLVRLKVKAKITVMLRKLNYYLDYSCLSAFISFRGSESTIFCLPPLLIGDPVSLKFGIGFVCSGKHITIIEIFPPLQRR